MKPLIRIKNIRRDFPKINRVLEKAQKLGGFSGIKPGKGL
jgi:hypothetical protein